ncbi:hypothetical protein GBAR_LOCUS31704 [Geodia barretti]|uniref:Uncharacterized protein n=1 Tax=Geodia barretti TaxID=519541 RepID=A0AA35XM57_GEOBA|nr:hypothetical protein GBAR_LOCUS31704 [Geodia barretti]
MLKLYPCRKSLLAPFRNMSRGSLTLLLTAFRYS